MKQILIITVAVTLLIGCNDSKPTNRPEGQLQISQAATTEIYTVDDTHSTALFQEKNFGISFVSGRFTDLFIHRNSDTLPN